MDVRLYREKGLSMYGMGERGVGWVKEEWGGWMERLCIILCVFSEKRMCVSFCVYACSFIVVCAV